MHRSFTAFQVKLKYHSRSNKGYIQSIIHNIPYKVLTCIISLALTYIWAFALYIRFWDLVYSKSMRARSIIQHFLWCLSTLQFCKLSDGRGNLKVGLEVSQNKFGHAGWFDSVCHEATHLPYNIFIVLVISYASLIREGRRNERAG